MYFKEYFPNPLFSKYIDSYFTVDAGLVRDNITDLVVPDGTFGLLFVDPNCNIGRNRKIDAPPVTLVKTCLFGQKTKPVNYYFSPGTGISFGIKINPEGLPLFIGAGLSEFCNNFLEIDGIDNRELLQLEKKILDNPDLKSRIDAIEWYIKFRLDSMHTCTDYGLFCELIVRIKGSKGEITIEQLAGVYRINYKKMERLFHRYLGINPKLYIRIVRFIASIHTYCGSGHMNLTQVGAEAGFFDQSHFIREFKCFTALTPGQFFTKHQSHSELAYQRIISERWK